jgi:protocadherin Fat 4
VRENAAIGQNVMTIKAHDLDRDSILKYNLKLDPMRSPGDRSWFGVRANSGTVFVKEPLDYETRKEYKMVLEVTDGKFVAHTNIYINVTDVNDCGLLFTCLTYLFVNVQPQRSARVSI